MSMHSFVSRFSKSAGDPLGLNAGRGVPVPDSDEDVAVDAAFWGSLSGFGNFSTQGIPSFAVPAVPNVLQLAVVVATVC